MEHVEKPVEVILGEVSLDCGHAENVSERQLKNGNMKPSN